MNCPSCDRANATDLVECEHCGALLVDIFAASPKTEVMEALGAPAASGAPILEGLERMPRTGAAVGGFSQPVLETAYTGDLPRLFRFGNRYQILEKLGEGGMGRVYKALDLELDRAVALKTIRAEKGLGPAVLERFKQELILARKVTHKNVIRIYDLGEADGMKFFTMELIEGKSLRDLLVEKGKLPIKQVRSVMKQMLRGLQEAHREGVIHRDLKPQNIMLDENGVLKIMDFGIARAADSATLTGTGEMMGTPDYISPEQVKGERTDAQSDLFSCGVILYEILTGEVPFKGDTALAKIVSRIQTHAKSPRSLNLEVPAYIERIIMKCLEVDRDLRYRSSDEVLEDLRREQVDRSLILRSKKLVYRARGALVAAFLLAGLVAGFWFFSKPPPSLPVDQIDVTTIAILPFHNLTANADIDWMTEGVPEMLITDISQSEALRPVLAEQITAILEKLGKSNQGRFDGETAQVLSEMAGADYALYGRFASASGRIRVDLSLRQIDSGVVIPIRLERAIDDVFGTVDAITEAIQAELDLESEVDRPVAEVSTSSLGAFRLYHQAVAASRTGANQAAIELLKEATRLDPKFAMAHAKLAEAHFHLGAPAEAKKSISIAIELSQETKLPISERYQIYAIEARIDEDPEKAVQSYRKLAELYPNNPDVGLSLASALETLGKVNEAADQYRRVLERFPDYGAATLGLGRMLVVAGQPDEAAPLLRKAVADGQFEGDLEALGMVHSILGVAYRDQTDYSNAILELEKSLEYRRSSVDRRGEAATLTNLANVFRSKGAVNDARDNLRDALVIAVDLGNIDMESFALLNLGMVEQQAGNLDEALANYRSSLQIEWELKENAELPHRLDAIADIYRLRGQYAEAMVYLEQAKVHLESSEDMYEQAFNLATIGRIKKSQGHYQEASTAFLKALPMLQEVGQIADATAITGELAELYLQQGRYDESLAAAKQGIVWPDGLQLDSVSARAGTTLAQVLTELGRVEEAGEQLTRVQTLVADTKEPALRAVFELRKGSWLRSTGDASTSLLVLQSAARNAERSGDLVLALSVKLELARALLDLGRVSDSLESVEEARRELERRYVRPLDCIAILTLAEAQLARGNLVDAHEAVSRARQFAENLDSTPLLFQTRLLSAIVSHRLDSRSETQEHLVAGVRLMSELVENLPTGDEKAYLGRQELRKLMAPSIQILEELEMEHEASIMKDWLS